MCGSRFGILILSLVLVAFAPGVSRAGFADLESEVVEFKLDNGVTFLVVERHDAPVFSFCTQVDAGGVNEVPGITGVAHMFEHMAFKGTHTIGTKDYNKEVKALDKIDKAFDLWLDEYRKGPLADGDKLAALKTALKNAQTEAQKYVITNEFTQILEENGVSGLNAQTGLDFTRYFYSLPSNRLELWALMEGDRLANVVTREFNVERDVVIEEKRMRYESSPNGRLQGNFLALAFPAHPYGDGVIGHTSDLMTFTRQDALDFYKTYYVGSNITVVVVGDVDADEVHDFAEKYFSDIRKGPKPPRVDTLEPVQAGERRLIIEDPAQPLMLLGYPIPEARHPDYTSYEVLAAALGQGRSSRLYKRLVKEKGLAAAVFGFTGFPGDKYPNLLGTFAVVAAGADPAEVEQETYQVIEKDLRDDPITEAELDGARTRIKASLIRSLTSNQGLALNLGIYASVYGDWKKLFRAEEMLDAVTVDDLKRVAASTFKRSNRNVGVIVNPTEKS